MLMIPWEGWFPGNLDWWTIDLLAFLFLTIAVLVSLCVNSILRRWRRLLSLLLTPVFLLTVVALLASVGLTADRIRFALTKNEYLAEIQRLDANSAGPHVHTFAWDDTFVAKSYVTLVYDESDKIASRDNSQSESDEITSVRPLGDHFYLLDEYYPDAFP